MGNNLSRERMLDKNMQEWIRISSTKTNKQFGNKDNPLGIEKKYNKNVKGYHRKQKKQ